MKKVYYLVRIEKTFKVMLNPFSPLNCNMCNSAIFENKQNSELKTNVFEYFKTNLVVFSNIKLDMRTTKNKMLVKKYGFFSAEILPKIAKLKNTMRYTLHPQEL